MKSEKLQFIILVFLLGARIGVAAENSKWEVLNQEALSLYNQGKYNRAIAVGRKALNLAESEGGTDESHLFKSINNLAVVYRTLGRYDQAEPLYRRAVAIAETSFGSNDPLLAASFNNLALFYKTVGQYANHVGNESLAKRAFDQAEPLYKRALEIVENAFGSGSSYVAANLNNIAELFHAQGRYSEAEPLYKRALAIKEKVLGPDDASIATTLSNLGSLYEMQLQYGEAEPLYKRALAIQEKSIGADHFHVAKTLNNLAGLYHKQQKYNEAESLYKRALDIKERAVGSEHPSVAITLHNLADLYHIQGFYARAEPLYQRALAILESAFGAGNPRLAETLDGMADVHRKTGRDEKAKALSKRAAGIRAQDAVPLDTTLHTVTGRGQMGCASACGKIYLFGGFDFSGVLDLVEVYDPLIGGVSTLSPMPLKLTGPAAAQHGDAIYVIGGRNARNVSNDVHRLDLATSKWTSCAKMSTRRWVHVAAASGGKLYVFGGIEDTGRHERKPLATVEVYDPSSDSWEAAPSMPEGRSAAAVATISGRIYIIGGRGIAGFTDGSTATNSVYVFSPESATWSQGPDLPTPRMSCSTAVINDTLYLFGGSSAGVASDEVYYLAPPHTDWKQHSLPLPTSRTGAAFIAVRNTVHILGGASGSNTRGDGPGIQFITRVDRLDLSQ